MEGLQASAFKTAGAQRLPHSLFPLLKVNVPKGIVLYRVLTPCFENFFQAA